MRQLSKLSDPEAASSNGTPRKSVDPFKLMIPGHPGFAELTLSEVNDLQGHAKKHSEVGMHARFKTLIDLGSADKLRTSAASIRAPNNPQAFSIIPCLKIQGRVFAAALNSAGMAGVGDSYTDSKPLQGIYRILRRLPGCRPLASQPFPHRALAHECRRKRERRKGGCTTRDHSSRHLA